ncbi:hypothetical protein VST03_04750, partial [Lactobacillus delbrueckii subsp. allosunkii]|uniref:hypothetical protein n=1 Tax=Lactobacillus delbrueckii TaxID=1584 RepID=UPI003A87D41E
SSARPACLTRQQILVYSLFLIRQICFFIRFMIGAPGRVVVAQLSPSAAINWINSIFPSFNKGLFLFRLLFPKKAEKISAIFSRNRQKKLGKRKMAT